MLQMVCIEPRRKWFWKNNNIAEKAIGNSHIWWNRVSRFINKQIWEKNIAVNIFGYGNKWKPFERKSKFNLLLLENSVIVWLSIIKFTNVKPSRFPSLFKKRNFGKISMNIVKNEFQLFMLILNVLHKRLTPVNQVQKQVTTNLIKGSKDADL